MNLSASLMKWLAAPFIVGLVLIGPNMGIEAALPVVAATESGGVINYNTPVFQELGAKRWLLKHAPVGPTAFGMPGIDRRTKKEILRDQAAFTKSAKKYVKDHPDVAYFLGKSYGVTDEAVYQTIQQMEHIQLTKTDSGFIYQFQGGGGCFVREYTGTLAMNGNVVTKDTMTMEVHGVPC